MRKTILLITLGLVGLSSQSQALTASTTRGTLTIDFTQQTTGTIEGTAANGVAYSFNTSTGILSGLDAGQGFNITFGNKEWEEDELIIFTSAIGNGPHSINKDSTGLLGAANGGLNAVWGDHDEYNYCYKDNADNIIGASSITDTIKVKLTNSNGVFVYNASDKELKHIGGLHSGTATLTKTYINTDRISSLSINEDRTYTFANASGTWSKTYTAAEAINAGEGQVDIYGSSNGTPVFQNYWTADKDIIAGGKGHVFLQEWGKGNIVMANDFYIASRTDGGEAIHFGSDKPDSTTTLTGNIYLIEDAAIKARGEDTVSIQGKVTDKNVPGSTKTDGGYKLTVTGEGYEFTGDVDVTTLEFGATQGITQYTRNTEATFTKGFKADNLILNTGNEITSDVAISGLTTLTVKGADATLDAALNLSTATTLTLDAALALGDNDLTLGSMTLAGTLFTTMDTTLETSETLTLFTGVNSLTLGTTSYAGAVDASTVFTNLAAGNYSLVYADSVVALKKGVTDVVPEPTTATLSLLALCGLAMRRRRK